ncbi:MAG: PIN domain-containing protein [Candidatus Hydrogenedentota bacterium]
MTRVFLDTNILVYSVDDRDPRKRDISLGIQRERIIHDHPVLSTQILQEFYSTVTSKGNMHPVRAKEIMKSWENIETVLMTPSHIVHAIDISIINMISFWDGLILAAAASARCAKVLTEDMQHGQTIADVLIENPFL